MTPDALAGQARAWLSEDPDPETRAELTALLEKAEAGDAEAERELADRFDGTLEFGTAGLRGALGAGPNRMNRVVVIRAAAGLAAYLVDNAGSDEGSGEGRGGAVVIGYDARKNSAVFAKDTAQVLAGAGLRALLLPRALPTPVLAYAIRELRCVAGVMVTASHNPPQDNGYKVYLGSGSQIVPPADTEISARIAAVGSLGSVPRGERWETLDGSVLEAYVERCARLVPADAPRDVSVVYTPMHGVGGDVVRQCLERAGFAPAAYVARQAEPDPAFPTVAFPNPEEPGALDLAYALARERGADVILANDPDADRCAVAVPDPSAPDAGNGAGGWRRLTGDQVGALLATHLIRSSVRGIYATSIVSSSLLRAIAERHDLPYAQTLTGFKWLGRIEGLAFGYEEALGYCVDPAAVGDKDGISALLRLAELAAGCKAEGRTLLDLLDDIAREFGVYATEQVSIRVEEIAQGAAMVERLLASPPSTIGGRRVTRIDDLTHPSDELPPTEGVRFTLDAGADPGTRGRVIVRPSGTEPKLKCYLEAVVPLPDASAGSSPESRAGKGSGDPLRAARTTASRALEAIRTDLEARLA